MPHDDLGTRIKSNYEDRARHTLVRRMPAIIRVDGRAFHTLTANYQKPFDPDFMECMLNAAYWTAREIQGCKAFYVQSDEVSFLLVDYDRLTSEAWFDYNQQKMVSVAAATMSVRFNEDLEETCYLPVFDGRAFNLPREEVANYFLWRIRDWERNSVQMLARAHFPHKELHKKSVPEMHEMLHQKGINWTELSHAEKNGAFLTLQDGYLTRAVPERFTYEVLSDLLDPLIHPLEDDGAP